MTLSIDPGRKYTGWALFNGMQLVACGVSRTGCTGESDVIADHVRQIATALPLLPSQVVVEQPQSYELTKQKGDQNDLIRIFGIGCAIAGHFRAPVYFVYPRTWKGQLPKDVSHRRIESRLYSNEIEVMNKLPKAKTVRHNGMDAIGIGLWKLGRRQ